MSHSRPAAVAGLFYPGEPALLGDTVAALLDAAGAAEGPAPRALIAPHAGYVYSGAAAATAYARLAPWREQVDRVLLLGPPHRVPVRTLAVPGDDAFATPLGEVPLDRAACDALAAAAGGVIDDRAHADEHSLEVHLPFLQHVLGAFSLVPALVGEMAPAALAACLRPWWDDARTLVVVSTDLSHFLDYAGARARDGTTDRAIMALDPAPIGPEQACGCRPLNGLLYLAGEVGASIERLALCNSGDTAGDRARVVGYAAYALH